MFLPCLNIYVSKKGIYVQLDEWESPEWRVFSPQYQIPALHKKSRNVQISNTIWKRPMGACRYPRRL